jgi:hypothetical protein
MAIAGSKMEKQRRIAANTTLGVNPSWFCKRCEVITMHLRLHGTSNKMILYVTVGLVVVGVCLRANLQRTFTMVQRYNGSPSIISISHPKVSSNYTETHRHTLRLDWTNLPVISPLAKVIAKSQTRECNPSINPNQKFRKHTIPDNGGLGSTIHTWSQSLCHAMDLDMIVVTRGPWLWMSEEHCSHLSAKSPFQCYFGAHEEMSPTCLINGTDDPELTAYVFPHTEPFGPCHYGKSPQFREEYNSKYDSLIEYRAAAMEFLFQSVRPIVIEEVQRQIRDAFPYGLPNPNNMVTVNVRWGDKQLEMDLLPIERYIDGVHEILKNRPTPPPNTNKQHTKKDRNEDETIHIYLTTEDSRAIHEFRNAAPSSWIVHTSGPTISLTNNFMMAAENANGKNGLESMAGLLIAMESNGYVLTTGSNWSRLLNELRKNVVNPRCGNCTSMIDLSWGEW